MRAEAVGAQVQRTATKAGALQAVAQLLRDEGVTESTGAFAVWANCKNISPTDRQQLCANLPGLQFEVTRENAERAKVGISEMDWALANTGTLVQVADAVDKRLVSTLPPAHIALVSTSSILPDLPAVLAKLDPSAMPYVAFITGPSRTADIERVLTIGVHGPARLFIVLIDEMEASA